MSSNRYLFDIIKNCNPGAQIQAETQIMSQYGVKTWGVYGKEREINT